MANNLQFLIDTYRFHPTYRTFGRLALALRDSGPVRSHGKDVWQSDGVRIFVSAPPDPDGVATTAELSSWKPTRIIRMRIEPDDYASIPEAASVPLFAEAK